ncbi:MAG: DHHA1 domain-containing protein [Nitrososphaeraceae archaeon]
MNKTIVIYHGGCRDGFCAAWVYNKYLMHSEDLHGDFSHRQNTEYYPGYYGQEPPDVIDKDVIILDFCYPLEIMQSIIIECKSLIWLDHHKTAIEFANWLEQTKYEHVKFIFDNNRSGAGLTWDYFFPNEPRPWLVDYVEDRDLWAKKLNYSDEINSLISCLEFKFEVWDKWSNETVGYAKNCGQIAEMKTEQYIREVCKNVYFANFINYVGVTNEKNIPTVNICQIDCSEVMHELCKKYPESPFSLYWFKRQDGMYQYGMRSIGDFDVSNVAKLFGGGGHKNAAGFQLNYLLEELK